MVALRRSQSALSAGDIRFLDSEPGVLAFLRVAPGQTLLCAFNLDAQPATLALGTEPELASPEDVTPAGLNGGALAEDGRTVALPAFGTLFAQLG